MKAMPFHAWILWVKLIMHAWTHMYTGIAWRQIRLWHKNRTSNAAFMWHHYQSTSGTEICVMWLYVKLICKHSHHDLTCWGVLIIANSQMIHQPQYSNYHIGQRSTLQGGDRVEDYPGANLDHLMFWIATFPIIRLCTKILMARNVFQHVVK